MVTAFSLTLYVALPNLCKQRLESQLLTKMTNRLHILRLAFNSQL